MRNLRLVAVTAGLLCAILAALPAGAAEPGSRVASAPLASAAAPSATNPAKPASEIAAPPATVAAPDTSASAPESSTKPSSFDDIGFYVDAAGVIRITNHGLTLVNGCITGDTSSTCCATGGTGCNCFTCTNSGCGGSQCFTLACSRILVQLCNN